MFMEIVGFLLIGLVVVWLSSLLLAPINGSSNVLFFYALAVLGAVVLGLITPSIGLFALPYVFFGSLIMAFLGAILPILIIAAIISLVIPSTKTEPKAG